MTAATGGTGSKAPTPRAGTLRIARITAGTTAGVASLALTLLLTTAPERLGLSPTPALFEKVQAEDPRACWRPASAGPNWAGSCRRGL